LHPFDPVGDGRDHRESAEASQYQGGIEWLSDSVPETHIHTIISEVLFLG
jgi:hypothetical protein